MRRTKEIVSGATKQYFTLDKSTGDYVADEEGLLAGLIWTNGGFDYRIVMYNMDMTMLMHEYINFVYDISVYTTGNEWVANKWNVIKTSQIQYNNFTYVNKFGEEVPKDEAVDEDTGDLKNNYYRQLDFVVGALFKGTIDDKKYVLYDYVLYDISVVEGLSVAEVAQGK